jgi:hypothetical protein
MRRYSLRVTCLWIRVGKPLVFGAATRESAEELAASVYVDPDLAMVTVSDELTGEVYSTRSRGNSCAL